MLGFVGEGRVGEIKIPGQMLNSPTIGFHQLVVYERESFKIARFGDAAAAVGDSSAKTTLLVEDAGAVADKRLHRRVRACWGGLRWNCQFSGGPGVVEKQITAVGFEIEQPKISFGELIAGCRDRYRLTPEQLTAGDGGRGFELGYGFARVALGSDGQRVVTTLGISRIVGEQAKKF